MLNNEAALLNEALIFEEGHLRRTQHILMVYSLSKLIAEREGLSQEQQQIVKAAAILHDIAIKTCKEKYKDASQSKQQVEAPALVKRFLSKCDYIPSYRNSILELVLKHHDYCIEDDMTHQVLIEADILVGCFESQQPSQKAFDMFCHFQTKTGTQILRSIMEEEQLMELGSIQEKDEKYIENTYRRFPLAIISGKGAIIMYP